MTITMTMCVHLFEILYCATTILQSHLHLRFSSLVIPIPLFVSLFFSLNSPLFALLGQPLCTAPSWMNGRSPLGGQHLRQ